MQIKRQPGTERVYETTTLFWGLAAVDDSDVERRRRGGQLELSAEEEEAILAAKGRQPG